MVHSCPRCFIVTFCFIALISCFWLKLPESASFGQLVACFRSNMLIEILSICICNFLGLSRTTRSWLMCSLFWHWLFLSLMAIAPHFTSYLGTDTEKKDGQVYIACSLAVNWKKKNDNRERENCECILLVTNIKSMLAKKEKKKADGRNKLGSKFWNS